MSHFARDANKSPQLELTESYCAYSMSDLRKWASFHNKVTCCWPGFSSQCLLCSMKGRVCVRVFSCIHAHDGAFITETL